MAKKPRKWSNLDAPEPPVVLDAREQAIREVVAELPRNMKALAIDYVALEEEEAFAALEAKRRSIRYAALERVIRDQLALVESVSGQDTWRGEGCTFSPKNSVIPQMEDRTAFHDWIKATGRESFLDVSPPRVKSLLVDALNEEDVVNLTQAERAALKQGEPGSLQPPPGLKFFVLKGINFRKA